MQSISTIGLDIAKSVFQARGIGAAGQVVVRRQLRRRHVLAFFPEAAAMPGRNRGVRFIAPLVPRAAGAGACGAKRPPGGEKVQTKTLVRLVQCLRSGWYRLKLRLEHRLAPKSRSKTR